MIQLDWNINKTILYGTIILVAFGLVMVFNASLQISQAKFGSPHYLFYKQLFWALVGIATMFASTQVSLKPLRDGRIVFGLYLITIVPLVAVFFQPAINNTHRWLRFSGISFQPSELAKLTIPVFLAWYLARVENIQEKPLMHLVRLGAVIGPITYLICREPDLGNAMMIVIATGLVLYFAGLSFRHLAMASAAGFAGFIITILLNPYMWERIKVYFDFSNKHIQDHAYQINQSLIAVGHSGFWGMGLGQSTQKLFFLPEPHTDFVYAVLAEELGFLGCLVLALLFVFLFIQGFRVSLRSQVPFYRYLGISLASMFMIQTLINNSMVVALGPTKGIPLPFISMGGTCLLINLLAVGVIINISRETVT